MPVKAMKQKGFTLIELLIVIGIIAVLIGVFVANVNLSRPFQQARDAQRAANVNSIASAIKQRVANYKGSWRAGTPAGCLALPTGTADNISAADYDLYACLVPDFMSQIPWDPSTGSSVSANYTVLSNANGTVTITAPDAEGGPITVTN